MRYYQTCAFIKRHFHRERERERERERANMSVISISKIPNLALLAYNNTVYLKTSLFIQGHKLLTID